MQDLRYPQCLSLTICSPVTPIKKGAVKKWGFISSQPLLFYSKFRMRAPHDLDAILPEDTCKCFDLLA